MGSFAGALGRRMCSLSGRPPPVPYSTSRTRSTSSGSFTGPGSFFWAGAADGPSTSATAAVATAQHARLRSMMTVLLVGGLGFFHVERPVRTHPCSGDPPPVRQGHLHVHRRLVAQAEVADRRL